MSVCTNCRLALRQTLRKQFRPWQQLRASSSKPSVQQILSKPSWSIRSLLASTTDTPPETITPTQLHHLLRLSALPPPKTPAEEASMIATLQSQLHFVRAVQRVDTTGVEPLRAIRDETDDAIRESTVGLDDLRDVLAKEELVGHYKRPRRVKEKVEVDEEKWDALGMASRKAGRYFVVQSKSESKGESGEEAMAEEEIEDEAVCETKRKDGAVG